MAAGKANASTSASSLLSDSGRNLAFSLENIEKQFGSRRKRKEQEGLMQGAEDALGHPSGALGAFRNA